MEISHKVSHTFDWKSSKSNGVLPNHWKDLVIYTPCVDFLAFTITSNDAEEHNLKMLLMNMGHGRSTIPAGKQVVTIRACSPCDSRFTSDSKHWGVKEGAGLYPVVCRTRWLPVHGSNWSFLWCPQTSYGEWPHTSYLPGFPTLTVEFCSLTAQQFSLSASHNLYDLSSPASLPSSQLMSPLPPTAHTKRFPLAGHHIPPSAGFNHDLKQLQGFHRGLCSLLRPEETLCKLPVKMSLLSGVNIVIVLIDNTNFHCYHKKK